MCGIAGFFDLASRERRPDAADIAARQIAAIRYRGPDAQGLHVGPGVALAHARLCIPNRTNVFGIFIPNILK